jgi:hypothetical protein
MKEWMQQVDIELILILILILVCTVLCLYGVQATLCNCVLCSKYGVL